MNSDIHPDPRRLDDQLLFNGPVSLYFSDAVLARDLGWLETRGYVRFELDCSDWESARDFHLAAAEAFRFPADYGKNMRAFNDSLGDVAVPDPGAKVIVFRCFDRFSAVDRGSAEAILDIIATHSRWGLISGTRLLCLVQTDDPRLELPPVGAAPVLWNPREWVDPGRGG